MTQPATALPAAAAPAPLAAVRPWHTLVVLALLALGLTGYGWMSQRGDWAAPRPRLPDLPQVTLLQSPDNVQTTQAQAKPLLWTGRRPIQAQQAAAPVSTQPQEPDLAQAKLLAVLESGRERVALVRQPDGSTSQHTPQSRPWRLQSFDGHQAVLLSASGQRAELALEQAVAAAAPPPSAPARAAPAQRRPRQQRPANAVTH